MAKRKTGSEGADVPSVTELRADLATFRARSHKGRPYPREMRERAMAYAAERLRAGAETWEIATELGVYEETVRRWMLGVGAESPAASAARDSAAAATGCRQRVGADSPAAPAAKGPDLSLIPLVVGGHQVDESRHRLRIDLQDGTRVHAWGLAVSDVLLAIQALRRGR